MPSTWWCDNIFPILDEAAENDLSIKKRIELIEKAKETADPTDQAINDMEKWVNRLKSFLEPNNEKEINQWYKECKTDHDRGTLSRLEKIYIIAYKNFYFSNEWLISVSKKGLTIEERLLKIMEVKNILNENWRKNPEYISKLLTSLEELEKKLENLGDTNMKELLQYYVKAHSEKNTIDNIFMIVLEDYLNSLIE